MGRYTGPACRLCRREGMKLFLKGDRCNMAKCAIETGRTTPGMHGMQRSKPSDYSRQFREKQRLKRFYGLQDGQFRLTFQRALRHKGVTGDNLLQNLEMRLDNTVFRLGFAASRRAARQLVRHCHVAVNGHTVDIPSMQLKVGDRITIRENQRSRGLAQKALEAAQGRTMAPWLSLDAVACEGNVLRIPTRDEIAPIVNEQLVVELCSK
ncbi:MAG: 30S ribosomal protein S4 [Kiritimatiellia bacterium]|nr:30S ribosomal protein S4 [Lentisphaerota bacterium]